MTDWIDRLEVTLAELCLQQYLQQQQRQRGNHFSCNRANPRNVDHFKDFAGDRWRFQLWRYLNGYRAACAAVRNVKRFASFGNVRENGILNTVKVVSNSSEGPIILKIIPFRKSKKSGSNEVQSTVGI